MPYCPECLREYEVSGGFCPHDGKTLRAGKPPRAASQGDGENDAMARLRQHGIGTDNANEEDYDRFLGQVLDDRYKITRKLGEGGMGVVFYARHVVIEKPVAIKILKKGVSRDPSVVQRFIREAKAASRIGHPNIVDVTDFGTTPDGLAYQVMEYLEGATLADLIYSRKKLSLDEAAPIIVQMARALASAHEKGIVHRDLKPENVFLIERHGREDFVKIVDFGIAKVMATGDSRKGDGPRLTKAGSVFGTPEYMAPEQASGSTKIDRRADVYALGAIFYEMLVGKVPLQGINTIRTLAMVILDEVPKPSTVEPSLELPEKIEEILMKALAKKAKDRWSNMSEVADAIEKAMGKRLGPKIGSGIGSLPPMPAPSGAEISLPDTVPEVGLPDMDTAPEEAASAPGKPTEVFLKPKKRRSRASTFDPPFVETANPGYDAIPEPRVTEFLDRLEKKSAAPLIAAILFLLAGVAVAGYLFWSSGQDTVAAATADAASAEQADAGAALALLADAGTASVDAGDKVALKPDAGGKRRKGTKSPKTPAVSGAKKFSTVKVVTRPEGGRVFIGGINRGPDGVTIRTAIGSTMTITCKLRGHKDGRVIVRAKEPSHAVICDMKKRPRCLDGIKNPFGDCP